CVKWGVYAALAIAVSFFSVFYRHEFLTRSNIAEGIGSAVAVTAILGVGLTIALAAGQVDISGGAMMALSSFTFVAFVEHTNRGGQLFHARTSLPVALLIAVAVALVVGVVNGILVVNL